MRFHCAFNDIIYRRLRLLGVFFGLHVLQPDFRPNTRTVMTVIAAVSVLMLYISTAFNSDGDLAMSAEACIRTGVQVFEYFSTI